MTIPSTYMKHNSLSSPDRGKSSVAQGKAVRPQPWVTVAQGKAVRPQPWVERRGHDDTMNGRLILFTKNPKI